MLNRKSFMPINIIRDHTCCIMLAFNVLTSLSAKYHCIIASHYVKCKNLLAQSHVLSLIKHTENIKTLVRASECVTSHLQILYFSKNEINVLGKI